MRPILRLAATLSLVATNVAAEAVQLSCVQDTGQSAGTVVVDLEAGTFKHGAMPAFSVVSDTDEHITAIDQDNRKRPGGLIWVIEKATGRFATGSVYLGCKDTSCTRTELTSFAMEGTCTRSPF